MSSPPPRVYIKTHSVKLVGGANGTLSWCASYMTSTGTATYRVFKVDSFDAQLVPQPGVNPVIDGTTAPLLALAVPVFGEEVGYGWDAGPTNNLQNTLIPGNSASGLYVLRVTADGATFTYAYFVVRTPSATTKVMVCYPFTTVAAYAAPPPGGKSKHTSLYESFEAGRLRRVSN